jgi:solute:Na+ symporter, SSS family
VISAIVIGAYLLLLLGLGLASNRLFRGTAADYFLASRGLGSFLLVMSLFGTTMTSFALVGSTGEAFQTGIVVYGLMASWSGLVHSACFFLVGLRLWALGKRHNYMTQIQFFRDRFESDRLGLVLFPVLVGLVVPYLLIGVMGGGQVLQEATRGAFPGAFPASEGGVPYWLGGAVLCLVVLLYVFFGGIRGTAWANALQTSIFVTLGIVAVVLIARRLGGPAAATGMVAELNPSRLARSHISQLYFFSYVFIPLSVAMFPHVFQHWLTARRADTFRLAVVAHPLLILAVWLPCVLIGVWASSAVVEGRPLLPPDTNPNAVLGIMVNQLTGPLLGACLSAGVLAAIMSSLDSQFLALGNIFTNDMVVHYAGRDRFSERQRVLLARGFVVLVVAATYGLAVLLRDTRAVFTLGVWCFSGFSSLFPLVVAAIYWKRVTVAGAYASILAAAALWVGMFASSGFGADRTYALFGLMPVVPLMTVATAALVGVSLVTRPPAPVTLARFFPEPAAAEPAGSPRPIR